jgi:hypothetical protein
MLPNQDSVHIAEGFQRRRLKCDKLTDDGRKVMTKAHLEGKLKISQSETSRLCRPCLLTDRDEMSNLYRGPSIDASYQVLVHLAEGFQRWRLKCEKLTDDGCQLARGGNS